MAMHHVYVFLISVTIYCATNEAGAQENFVSERECPFLCTCAEHDVNCTNTNLFPDNIPTKTERFFLTNSALKFVPINAFLNLPNLKEIHFTDCKINILRACSFAELENMSSILFVNTHIDQIEGNAFSNLMNISDILFSRVTIGQMSSYSFHNVQHVERMEIFDSKIATIHPLAFLHFQNVGEIGILDTTVDQFLVDAFSRFSNVELMYISNSTVLEWQCGTLATVEKAGVDIAVSRSSFKCDCTLAWLWTKHSNASSVLNGSNRCKDRGTTLASVNVEQVCPTERSRNQGCPPLLPSTPHTCSRSFDSPKDPLEKVTYPTFFARTTMPSKAANKHVDAPLFLTMIMLMFNWQQ